MNRKVGVVGAGTMGLPTSFVDPAPANSTTAKRVPARLVAAVSS